MNDNKLPDADAGDAPAAYRPYDHAAYLASLPSPEDVLDTILAALRTAFELSLISGSPKGGRVVVSASGIQLTLEANPESISARKPGFIAGLFNWNGRWQIRVSPLRGEELAMRLLESQIVGGIERIKVLINRRIEIERQFEGSPGLRLVR